MRTLFRWQKRIDPKTTRNKPSTKVDMEALGKDVEEYPDHYQYERAKKIGDVQSTIFMLWESVLKKMMFHSKADELLLLLFQLELFRYECIEKRLIVYLDESGFFVDAPKERGYSLLFLPAYTPDELFISADL